MMQNIVLGVFGLGMGFMIFFVIVYGRDEIKQMLSEKQPDGTFKVSVMRVMTALIITVFLFNWTWYNISTNNLVGFSWEEIGLFVTLLGGKTAQKMVEGKNGKKKED